MPELRSKVFEELGIPGDDFFLKSLQVVFVLQVELVHVIAFADLERHDCMAQGRKSKQFLSLLHGDSLRVNSMIRRMKKFVNLGME
jgi:hypothetical protein